jgi:hypothetical protein
MRFSRKVINIIVLVIAVLSGHTAQANKPMRIKWPEDIAPKDVYAVLLDMNHYADALLAQRKLTWSYKPATVESDISPMVVFQLHLTTIQLLHHHELQLGLRPIPIVTASPIRYYPADVQYLSKLILERLTRIAKHYRLPLQKTKNSKPKHVNPTQVFIESLKFYTKLSLLSGYSTLTPEQLYNQVFRALLELRNIATHQLPLIQDKKNQRILAASLYGVSLYGGKNLVVAEQEKTLSDVFNKSLLVRKKLQPLLKKNRLPVLALPIQDPKQKPSSLDIFIQTQIILAELSEWKDSEEVAMSTPVTVLAKHKTYRDVYQALLKFEFILDKLLSTS